MAYSAVLLRVLVVSVQRAVSSVNRTVEVYEMPH